MSSRLHHFHSGYCPLSLPSHPFAHNGRWHDNMLYQAPSFVYHRQRIGCRENNLSVAMSRRGCLLPLGALSWPGYGWKGSVGGWRRPPWLWWVRCCKISLDFVCVLKCEILAGNISSQKTTVSALPFQVSYARGLDTRQVVASCDHTVHVPAKSQACIEKREEKAKAKKGRIWVLVDRDW